MSIVKVELHDFCHRVKFLLKDALQKISLNDPVDSGKSSATCHPQHVVTLNGTVPPNAISSYYI